MFRESEVAGLFLGLFRGSSLVLAEVCGTKGLWTHAVTVREAAHVPPPRSANKVHWYRSGHCLAVAGFLLLRGCVTVCVSFLWRQVWVCFGGTEVTAEVSFWAWL